MEADAISSEIVAVHESLRGTNRTSGGGAAMSVARVRPEVGFRGDQVAL